MSDSFPQTSLARDGAPGPTLTLTPQADEAVEPELVAVGERYWALAGFDEENRPVWCEKASDIDTEGWGGQTYVVAAAGVAATVPSYECADCGGPLVLTSRSAYQQVCEGEPSVCVDCTPSLTTALRALMDPSRKAKRQAAQEKARKRQELQEAAARWQQHQRDLITQHHPLEQPAPQWEKLTVRQTLAALALLRYAPSTTPITALNGWADLLHPNPDNDTGLLGDLVRADVLAIHPSSPPSALKFTPPSFEDALAARDEDGTIPEPKLVDRFFPRSACYFIPGDVTSLGKVAERADSECRSLLDPMGKSAAHHDDLVQLAHELIVDEALRYFDNQLHDVNLPAVTAHHRARLREAAYKAAEARPLGEIYSLAWRATRAAATAAQKNPRAPRANMSTHAVNQMENYAQIATDDPDWTIKPFSMIANHPPAAMTRTLFYTVLDADPLRTTPPDILKALPEPEPMGDSRAAAAPEPADDPLEALIVRLHHGRSSWEPEDVPRALAAVQEQKPGLYWFEQTVLARGARQLERLYKRLAPTLGADHAALAVIAAVATLTHPISIEDKDVTVGSVLLSTLRAYLGVPLSEQDPPPAG